MTVGAVGGEIDAATGAGHMLAATMTCGHMAAAMGVRLRWKIDAPATGYMGACHCCPFQIRSGVGASASTRNNSRHGGGVFHVMLPILLVDTAAAALAGEGVVQI